MGENTHGAVSDDLAVLCNDSEKTVADEHHGLLSPSLMDTFVVYKVVVTPSRLFISICELTTETYG